jgi:large subunit ribosomal protein L4
MQVAVHNMTGEKLKEIELPAEVFEAPINTALMHQALVRQLANVRQGTHSTKSRGEVSRSKAKWYRQKGTGRARHGSRNAPIFVGGGVAHGPKPRSYRKKMPRKMRRAALRSALSVKAAASQIVLLDELVMAQPKTRDFVVLLERLGVSESTLVLLPEESDAVVRSVRNMPNVKALWASYLNVRDLLGYDTLLIPLNSLDVIQSILG